MGIIMMFVALYILFDPGDGERIDDMIYVDSPYVGTAEHAVLRDGTKLWQNGEVFYTFETSEGYPIFSKEDKWLIEKVLKEIEVQVPCISFKKVDETYAGSHVIFTASGDDDNDTPGCYSYVGCVGSQGGKNGQIINLQSPGCINRRVVTHEVLHTLGFSHEQNRHDRSDYVDIVENNVMVNKTINFEERKLVNYGTMSTPYDFSSIMHYPRDAFNNDDNGDTIVSHSTENSIPFKSALDDNRGMSIIDIVELSRNYGKHTNTMCLPLDKVMQMYYDLENTENEGKLLLTSRGNGPHLPILDVVSGGGGKYYY